ncbi:MAG: hypothetical protein J5895_03735 [Alphaproteobacteria bacterium]|nr:hypothetical protein [Alphaproteobacteria bacterium]
MQNIKKGLYHVFTFLLCIGAVIVVGITLCILFLMLDREGHCLSEEGGVWDDKQKMCRQDCLTWNKKDGCVPMTEENIKAKEQGRL